MMAGNEPQTAASGGRWDIVVFRTRDTYERDHLLYADPPITARVDLGHDLFTERLDGAVARKVSAHCSAGAVENQIAQRYSFVRTFPAETDPADFDEDQRLQTTLALSRLIRPTSVGLEESAQVWGVMADASSLIVRPGPITGPASEAYVADRSRADWLTPSDAVALRELVNAFLSNRPPARILRGLWHHENAARALDMAARWTSVVTGLEALFNTDPGWITRQFKRRCAAAASELGVGLTLKQADTAYGLRSHLAHGLVTGVDSDTLELYVATERLLRETLRMAIGMDEWRNRLTDNASVRNAWPVDLPTECPTCKQPLPQDGPS